MDKKLVSVIVLNRNEKRWLKKCFDSLTSQTYSNIEIISVDNGSSDDSIQYIQENYPQVKALSTGRNLGYAGGNNFGINAAKGEYILIINPDTWMEPDFLEKLVDFFENHDYDLISPLEADYETKAIKAKDFYTRMDPLGHTISFPRKNKEELFNVCGFCLLFRKSFYQETQGMDSNFLIYLEEVDWCWRLRLLRKKVGLAENVHFYHAGTATGKKLSYFTFTCRNQNIPQMLIKNYAWYNLLWVLPLYLLQNMAEIIFFLILLEPKIAWTYVAAWGFVIKNLPGILKKRKWVQANRQMGDGEVMKKYFYFGSAKFKHLISHYF